MVGVQRFYQHLEVPSCHELMLHVSAVAHKSEHASAEYLQTVMCTVPLAYARCTLLACTDNAFVHGDIVVQAGHYLTRIQGEQHL